LSGSAAVAPRRALAWQVASVTAVTSETASVRTIALELPDWPGHRAGQHLDVRLTADDGYRAERSYSIAAAPGEAPAITVERLDDGEVSPYLTDELRAGDQIEVRGPIGGYFVWDSGANENAPLLLVAGGSGIVPLRSILRHRARSASTVPARLLYSAKSLDDVIYRTELDDQGDGVEVCFTLTRRQPPGWTGYAKRVDDALLAQVAWPVANMPLAFVCGPTPFVETVAAGLVSLGYPAAQVKTERFGGAGRENGSPRPQEAGGR
jgi:ferredoxin-NADP reductase